MPHVLNSWLLHEASVQLFHTLHVESGLTRTTERMQLHASKQKVDCSFLYLFDLEGWFNATA